MLSQQIRILSKSKWNLGFNTGCLVLFMALLYQGPILQQDSSSYIDFLPTRSPLYPLILKLNVLIAGPDNFYGLIFFQLILGFYSAFQLSEKFRSLFSLDRFSKNLFILALLLPYYYGGEKFGNWVMTEAIAYPLFLMAVGFLLEGLLRKSTRSLLYCLGFTSLVILTRRQFLFIYPVFALCLGYLFFVERKNFQIGILVLSFIGSIFATNLFEKTYQYIRNGHFSTVPFTGIQLIIAPLYVSKDSDVTLFQDEDQKRIFLEVRKQMHQKNITFEDLNKPPFESNPTMVFTQFYENYYNTICWDIVAPVLNQQGFTDVFKRDEITIDMALTLIQHNFKNCLQLYLRGIIYNMGGLYFSFFLLCTFFVAFIQKFKLSDNLSLAVLVTLLLSGANYSLIVLVEPIMRRYAAYTNTIQLCMLLTLVMIAMRKKV